MAGQVQRGQGAPAPAQHLAAPAPPPIDEGAVAEFLLRKKYFLAALELHQELQEGNNGMHSVSALNKFFNDPNVYQSLVKKVADEEAKNKAQSHGGKTASVQSPFVSDGLQPALAARDQKIALLEYRLRCTEADAAAAKQQLQSALAALQTQGGAPAGGKDTASASNASGSSIPLGADEEGGRISAHEKRTLNALVRRYLLSRGYKAAAVALAEEVTDQDLTGATDDTDLLALPGAARRSGGTGGVAVVTLLGMHRQRIAPIQALAESERRSDGEMAALRAEVRAVHEQLESVSAELSSSKARVAELEAELMHARTVRGGQQGQPGGATGGGAQGGAPAAQQAQAAAAPAPAAASVGSLSGKITMSAAPGLLRAITDALPTLHRITVTKQRVALAPLLAHAAAAEPSVDTRRALILSFLHLLRRPTYAERQLLKVQFGVLASRLGSSGAEQELLPELALLAKTGRGKEKRALAAVLAGALAAHVGDKRVDALLATLADLADSKHAIVRVAVLDGLTSVVTTLAERWQKALGGGVVPGQGSGIETFALRQYASVEETMWRALMGGASSPNSSSSSNGGGGHGSEGSTAAQAEAEELAAANDAEHQLQIPPALAFAGTPQADVSDGKSKSSYTGAGRTGGSTGGPLGLWSTSKEGNAPAPGTGLPAAWFNPPTSVLGAACSTLVPVLVPWAYRLGGLWGKTLPGWMAHMQDTLYTPGPGAPLVTPPPGAPAPAVRATEWHARNVCATLRVLGASAVRIRQALLDAGPTITYTGPADPAPAPPAAEGVDGAAAAPAQPSNPATDYIYELFDNASGAAVSTFPPELPLAAAVRGGQTVYPPGTTAAQHAAGQLPAQQRQALVLAALLRGTASVRRRKNTHINAATLPPGTAVWQILPDAQAAVAWPALQWMLRTLVPTLMRQAATVSRSSAAGREILDGYAEALSGLGAALGPAFTAYGIRPAFLRAFGIPVDLPPAPPAPGAPALPPPVPGLPQPLLLALQPGAGGRAPSLLPLAQILMGVPAAAADAKKAAMAAAQGNFSGAVNYASAGPKGGDWPYVLPELSWLSKDSPENPSHAGKTTAALQALVDNRKAELAAAPPPTAPGVPQALIRERLGGAWNAELLLPVFGSGVLACPALSQRELLDHALQGLVTLVAGGKAGWGNLQSLLEDAVMRAGGGSSSAQTGGAGGSGSGSPPTREGASLSTTIKPGSGAGAHAGGGTGQAGGTVPPGGVAADPTAAAAAERAAVAAANLRHILHEVLPRMASSNDAGVKTCGAGLLRSVIPLLAPEQIADPWLPTVKKLAGEGEQASVVRAAVRALATIYSTPAANDAEVRGLVNGEVTSLLAQGPKDIVLEVLRSLMRAVPLAPPATRDGFILDRLLEMSERVAGSAEAGNTAMRELVAQIGDVDPGDVHNAAAAALRATRAAAIQAAAPWPGAKPDDLEETAMALCECFRMYGSVIVSSDVKGMLREAGGRLLKADVLEPSYRDMMRTTLSALFPADPAPGMLSPIHAHHPGMTGGMGMGMAGETFAHHGEVQGEYGGEYGHEGGHHGADAHGHHAHADILSQFEAERQGGLLPPTAFDFEQAKSSHHHSGGSGAAGGSGLDDSMELAAKDLAALGSSLSHAMKGISLKGTMGGMGMSMGGMGMGMGFGMKGLGGVLGSSSSASAPAPAAATGHGKGAEHHEKARRDSRSSATEEPATLSLSSFAAAPTPAPAPAGAGGPGSRRSSGTAGADQPAFSMSSFMGGPAGSGAAPAPAPAPIEKEKSGLGLSLGGAGGGLLKSKTGPAAGPAGGASKTGGKGLGIGDRMRKLGEHMDKMMEQ